jgi:T5SS/PEP-CTERM-associated repeat protein
MKPARALPRLALSSFLVAALALSSGFAATKKFDRHRHVSQGWNDFAPMEGSLQDTGSNASSGGSASLSVGSLGASSLVLSPGTPDNWNGGTGNWSTAGDWSTGVPGSNSDVTIYSGGDDTVTLDLGSTTINSLTLGGASNGHTSELTDGGVAQTLTITTAMNVGVTGALELTGGSTVMAGAASSNGGIIDLFGGTLNISGDVTNSGTIETVGLGVGNKITISGLVTNSGTFELLGSGDMASIGGGLTNAGTVDVFNGSTLNLSGDVTNSGTIETSGSDVSNKITISGSLTNQSGGELSLSGPVAMATLGSLSNAGSVDVENGSTLQINGDANNSGSIVTNRNGVSGGNTINITGTLTQTDSATLVLNGPGDTVATGALMNAGAVYVDGGSTLTVAGDETNSSAGFLDLDGHSTLTITGNVDNSGYTSANLFGSGGHNTLTISGMLTNEATGTLILLGPGDIASIGNGVVSAGVLEADSGSTLTITGNVDNSGLLYASGFGGGSGGDTITINGTLTNESNAYFVLFGPGDTASISNGVSNAGFLDADGGSTLTMTGNVDNSGYISTTGFGSVGNNTLIISGTLTNELAGQFVLYGPNDLVTIGNGVSNFGTIDVEGNSTLNIAGDVSNSGIIETDFYSYGGGNTLNVAGNLNNNSGATFSLNGTGDVANVGMLSNLGYVYVGSGATLNVDNPGGIGIVEASARFDILGNFNCPSCNGGDGGSGFANLTLIQGGTVILANGQETDIMPQARPLRIFGVLDASLGSTIKVQGDVDNNGLLATGAYYGGSGNSTIAVEGNVFNSGGSQVFLYDKGDAVGVSGDLDNEGGQIALFNSNQTLTVAGQLTNNGSFQVLGNGSTATIGGDMNVGVAGGGSLTIMNGASVTNQDGFVGNGAGSSGTATVSGAGSSWLNLGNLGVGINGGSGLLVVNNGGTVTAQTITIGTLGEVDAKGGTLMYTSLLNMGTLDPVGVANLIGNSLTVFPQGRVLLDIIGAAPGQYGQLDITGSALLSGLTVLDFMNGFAPKKGDVFDLINITGNFDFSKNTIDIEGLQPGFEYSIDFSNGELTLTALNDGVPLPEPATLLILIPGLLGMGYGLRRRGPRRPA